MNALDRFHPSIRAWFEQRFAAPTPVQAKAWPRIAAGEHVLATAPTGSGKTLTAFLWSLNQFAAGVWRPGATRVLYVSPLKALNNDIQRNLLAPLEELRESAGFPAISVRTRSGDTPGGERQRMLRHPPDILITTPESLMLLLTTVRGRQALATVETLILDEIHAVADNRRGAQLMVSVERLVRLAGEFQRIALSATVRPLDAVAAYVGGYLPSGAGREVAIIDSAADAAPVQDAAASEPVTQQAAAKEAATEDAAASKASTQETTAKAATVKKPAVNKPAAKEAAPMEAPAQGAAAQEAGGDRMFGKQINLRVRFPETLRDSAAFGAGDGRKIWEPLAESFRERIAGNRSTLFFTNSRRLAEQITLKVNEDQPAPLAYAHHGSLARDIRTEVERRLKAGELKAIVATSSLEMGIDIGHLDEVVLVQTPPSIAAALQRIGRAGHGVGEVSSGTLYGTHAHDLLEAAVLARAVAERDIEPLKPLENSLDALCQCIVSMCAHEAWPVDELFAALRASAPFRRLPREQFDLVLDMLAGRYAGSRVRELKARVALDRIKGTVQAHKSAVFALYNAGGSIPDRGYYRLRHADSGAAIGELDEEFVWEATTGQTFTLGTQNWQILRITHDDVIVRPARPGATALPFWRNESINRSFHFADRIGGFLESAEALLASGRRASLKSMLMEQWRLQPSSEQQAAGDKGAIHQPLGGLHLNRVSFEESAAEALCAYLERQREHAEAPLPHRRHLLLEWVRSGPDGYAGPDAPQQLVIHSFWGGRLNRPWALALEAAWRQRFDAVPEIHADNNAIVVQVKDEQLAAEILGWVTPENLDELLRAALERSGFFGARFRECAGRALLLTKRRFNQRLPLWMSRLQAKKLMTATAKYPDFPVLLETWRTCLTDEFDLPALRKLLGELADGSLPWTLAATGTPSPFAKNLTFAQVSRYMYADDTPERTEASALTDDLIAQAVGDERLRPRLKAMVIEAFEAKRQRRAPGYEPRSLEDWLEWAKERVLIPASEWPEAVVDSRLVRFTAGERAWVAHLETADALVQCGLCAGLAHEGEPPAIADPRTLEEFVGEMLSFYGPRTLTELAALLPPGVAELEQLLTDGGAFIAGPLVEGSDSVHFCDVDNLEALLRLQRAQSRAEVTAKPVAELPGFLAAWQGFGQPWSPVAGLRAVERLSGYAGPVAAWLKDFLAARFTDFADHHLDELIAQEQIVWLGCGNQQITLCYPEEAALHAPCEDAADIGPLFADPEARYGYHQLSDRVAEGKGAAAFNDRWWQAVWAGALLADSLTPLRLGEQRKYRMAPASAPVRRRARAAAQGWPGNWRLNQAPPPSDDPLERMEEDKEQVRWLLDRYGVLCREIANRETRWAALFKALRIMELAGEVTAGYFFEGLSGPQFMAPAALHRFHAHQAPQSFWMNATDPASPCGLSLDWAALPSRRAGNYLGFLEGSLALVIESHGQRLNFLVDPDHPQIDAATEPVQHLVRQRKRIRVATINDQPARHSPYLAALDRTLTRTTDHRHVYLER